MPQTVASSSELRGYISCSGAKREPRAPGEKKMESRKGEEKRREFPSKAPMGVKGKRKLLRRKRACEVGRPEVRNKTRKTVGTRCVLEASGCSLKVVVLESNYRSVRQKLL